ncbi:hypothetical protein PIB30_065605 [Stylosanthes scabra]|uniref:Uncharacterized protein n=1 Tax=Stylosanthes scabra TaxID=79078 RepID=A0ABU6SM64_9FABA|nr:hypothetical protein [Stylosanthes scabra]
MGPSPVKSSTINNNGYTISPPSSTRVSQQSTKYIITTDGININTPQSGFVIRRSFSSNENSFGEIMGERGCGGMLIKMSYYGRVAGSCYEADTNSYVGEHVGSKSSGPWREIVAIGRGYEVYEKLCMEGWQKCVGDVRRTRFWKDI